MDDRSQIKEQKLKTQKERKLSTRNIKQDKKTKNMKLKKRLQKKRNSLVPLLLIVSLFVKFSQKGGKKMIKIRIEGKGFEIARIVDLLVIAFREDVEVTGIYELDRNKSRAYVDIDSRIVNL